jgi:hypothetical protein
LEVVVVVEVGVILNDAAGVVVVVIIDGTVAAAVADPTATLTPPPSTTAPTTIPTIARGDSTNAAALFKTHTPADIAYPSTHGADPVASRRAQSRFSGQPWVRL